MVQHQAGMCTQFLGTYFMKSTASGLRVRYLVGVFTVHEVYKYFFIKSITSGYTIWWASSPYRKSRWLNLGLDTGEFTTVLLVISATMRATSLGSARISFHPHFSRTGTFT